MCFYYQTLLHRWKIQKKKKPAVQYLAHHTQNLTFPPLSLPPQGVLMAAASLVTSLAISQPAEYAAAVPIVATRLQKVCVYVCCVLCVVCVYVWVLCVVCCVLCVCFNESFFVRPSCACLSGKA